MKKLLLIIATLLASHASQANNELPLAELKKILSEQEYMQYTHELWQKDRKKAEVTDYSDKLNNRQGGNTLTVGPNEQCAFPTIQLAINFAVPGDTIFVGSGIVGGTDAKLNIDKELTLVGGLDSTCQVFTANRTILQLDDIGPVISINVTGGENVTLSGFDISGSQSGNQLLFTPGIFVTGNGAVTVSNSHIHNNKSFIGGGISAINGATVNINENTEIYANSADTQGGGIYCGQSTLNIIDTVIGRNGEGNDILSEAGEGGGLYSGNCNVDLGESIIGDGVVELIYNKAQLGAAIFSIDSNIDFGFQGSLIAYNRGLNTAGNGNALFTSNVNNIIFNDIKVFHNLMGSAIQINGSSDFLMRSTCHSPPCSEISENLGVSLQVSGDATASIDGTIFSNNKNTSVIEVTSSGVSGVNITNSVLSNNEVGSSIPLIRGNSETLINMTNITIANNIGYTSIFDDYNSGGELNFNGGIIWGNSALNLIEDGSPGAYTIANSIIQYNPTGMSNTIQADPLFANAIINDFHIKYESPARDHFNSNLNTDFEGDSRPQGLLDDAGADEWTDLIYKNSFEQE